MNLLIGQYFVTSHPPHKNLVWFEQFYFSLKLMKRISVELIAQYLQNLDCLGWLIVSVWFYCMNVLLLMIPSILSLSNPFWPTSVTPLISPSLTISNLLVLDGPSLPGVCDLSASGPVSLLCHSMPYIRMIQGPPFFLEQRLKWFPSTNTLPNWTPSHWTTSINSTHFIQIKWLAIVYTGLK